MPRKKTPQRRIRILTIPKESQIHQQNEKTKLKSTQKKYKNLRVARLDHNFYKVQEIKFKDKQERIKEIEKIDNNNLSKKENINNDSKEHEKTDQKCTNNDNSMIQHINININDKLDFFLSTFNQNLEDDFNYDEASDSWTELL